MSISAINAQNLSTEVVAGMTLSNWAEYPFKTGFQLGAKFELAMPKLANGIYTNAGLLFALKGCNSGIGRKLNAYFIEVPIHIGYKYSITNNFAIFGEVGPYIGFGLFGKSDEFYKENYDHFNQTGKMCNTFDVMNRFDVGVGLRVGGEIKKRYSISVGYDWGLLNTTDSHDTCGSGCKFKTLTISLGYKLNLK